jgi:hypothetical protein
MCAFYIFIFIFCFMNNYYHYFSAAYPPIGHILSNTGDILLLTHILERKCSCLSPSSLLDLSSFVLLLLSFASPSYIPGDASCFASVSYRNTTNHFISILTTLNGVGLLVYIYFFIVYLFLFFFFFFISRPFFPYSFYASHFLLSLSQLQIFFSMAYFITSQPSF